LSTKKPILTNVTVVDLFCGVGGLSHGFVKEKFNVTAGIDFDKSCSYAYEANNRAKFIHADLTKYDPAEIKRLFPAGSIKVLVGCAPCQPFSTYTRGTEHFSRWNLLYSFGNIIAAIKPEIVSMENVPNLLKHRKGTVFRDFLAVLEKFKYKVRYKIVDAKDYGVPQRRKRLILIASRIGTIEIPPITHKGKKVVTVRKAIGSLPKIKHGESHPDDLLHRARRLSPLNLTRIKATPAGGGWQNWQEKLVLDCHKKDTGKSYSSVYGRMKWNEVAPTMTTQCTGLGNGRYGHPNQDRAISLREAAIFQSFPKKYKFIDPKGEFYPTIIEQHIGNAVPVKLGSAIARAIRLHLVERARKQKPPRRTIKH
jgi:DNA (cytosine-5)-methyltransferase 1